MGCSSGGAAALTMGWFRPEWFRRLITYSGTFVDQQDDDAPEEAQYPARRLGVPLGHGADREQPIEAAADLPARRPTATTAATRPRAATTTG